MVLPVPLDPSKVIIALLVLLGLRPLAVVLLTLTPLTTSNANSGIPGPRLVQSLVFAYLCFSFPPLLLAFHFTLQHTIKGGFLWFRGPGLRALVACLRSIGPYWFLVSSILLDLWAFLFYRQHAMDGGFLLFWALCFKGLVAQLPSAGVYWFVSFDRFSLIFCCVSISFSVCSIGADFFVLSGPHLIGHQIWSSQGQCLPIGRVFLGLHLFRLGFYRPGSRLCIQFDVNGGLINFARFLSFSSLQLLYLQL